MQDATEPPATLDVQGLACPLPVLKAARALRGLSAGAKLIVLATDAAAPADFRAFCQETGHALLASSESALAGGGTQYRFVLRKRDA